MKPGACKGPRWTAAENAILREFGPKLESSEVAAMLPGRSVAAVFHRLPRLGIQKRRRWTTAEDERLRILWGEPIRSVAKELGRTIITVYWRAQKLGLPLGVPEGGERLSNAAVRSGFALGTLRSILEWHRVPILRALTREAWKTKRVTHWVESDLVDEAVEHWLKTETPHAASRRTGVTTARIVNRLLASGLKLPPRPANKCHWRIPSETIDRALAIVVKRGKHFEVRKEAA